MRVLAAVAVVALTLGVACTERDSSPDAELVTEEVPPPPDALVDPSDDPQERRVEKGLSGVLPGDFPSTLPVYEPATIVDIATAGDDRRAVTFLTPDPEPEVARSYPGRLEAAGWRRVESGEETTLWRRGEREVSVLVRPTGGGSEIVVRY